jgi:hypothetical protein
MMLKSWHGERMLRYWRDETLFFFQTQRLTLELRRIASASSGCPGTPAWQLWLGGGGWRDSGGRCQAGQLRRQAGQLQRQALLQQALPTRGMPRTSIPFRGRAQVLRYW